MGAWFECQDCPWGTNSPKWAKVHAEDNGHTLKETEDE